MDMDTKRSSSPAITKTLQNKSFGDVEGPEFHPCLKQYSELCTLTAIICSKHRQKTKRTFRAQRYSAAQIIRFVLFH